MFKRRASKLVASAGIAIIAITGLSAIPASAISNGTTPGNSENLNVAKIVTGYGTCTGVLVDAQWIATVASCFTQNPAEYANLKTTDPLLGARALFGTDAARKENTGIPIAELALYTGADKRDIVLAKLATPALNTTPMKLATTAPTKDEKLDFIGWGRTKTEWIPTEKKIGSFNINTVDAKELTITGYNPANTSLCLGDSGAPGIRTTTNGQELAAINSRSWQKNCIGTTQTTNDGAYATRTDDITPWIQGVINNGRAVAGLENNAFIEIRETAATDPKNGYACIALKSLSKAAGAEVRNEICTGPYISKKWELVEIDKSPNTFAIRNVLSDLCLAGAGEGQSLSQQNCDSVNAAQQWQFLALGKDVTRVRNVANGLFLTNNSVNENNIRPATLESTQFAAKQNWTPAVVGKARYDIAKPNDFISIESASVAGRFINHAGTKGTVGAINSSAPAAARQAASWKIVPGLGNPRCYSFQSMDTPNSYLLGIGPGAVVEVQPTTGKNLGDFTFCAEQAKFGNGAISFYRYTDAFRSLRMYDTKLYQAAYFDAGVPEADNQQWVVNDTAWKISSPLALPTP